MESAKLPTAIVDLDVYIPAWLTVVSNRWASSSSDLYLAHFGVGINEWRILTYLINNSGCIARSIAERVNIHKGVVSRSLKILERDGFAKIELREGQKRLNLTPKGRALYMRMAKAALERESLLLSGFSAEEKRQLRSFLDRMRENFHLVDAYTP